MRIKGNKHLHSVYPLPIPRLSFFFSGDEGLPGAPGERGPAGPQGPPGTAGLPGLKGQSLANRSISINSYNLSFSAQAHLNKVIVRKRKIPVQHRSLLLLNVYDSEHGDRAVL